MVTQVEDERLLVQIRLPRSLVKEIDHRRIDWDLSSREQVVERMVNFFILTEISKKNEK